MNLENFLEQFYRKLAIISDGEFSALYSSFENKKLKNIFETLHSMFVDLFSSMNTRLPTNDIIHAHYWAEPSRQLIDAIEICERLERGLNNSPLAFAVDEYYKGLFAKCKEFLSSSGGSTLPPNMDKINIYYTLPVFIPKNSLKAADVVKDKFYDLKNIGEGSYAQVFKYFDNFYQKTFALKRAKKNLNDTELARFKREFESMKSLSSPYIVEVYCYHEKNNEYIMEFMSKTLDKYISENNSKLKTEQRKNICNQILRAFQYIHSRKLLHRDISPNNVLIKEYDDLVVVKISDFGLVKIPESNLTSLNTDLKGCFNDQSLLLEGFGNYNILHETFALTRLLLFVMTGKTRTDRISDEKLKALALKGLNSDMSKRFKSAEELSNYFKSI